MEIKKFEMFLDGGTIKITTDKGIFCFDYRIHTKTKGMLYNDIPQDDNSNMIENSGELENEIIEALKLFDADFYQTSIEYLINSKQK